MSMSKVVATRIHPFLIGLMTIGHYEMSFGAISRYERKLERAYVDSQGTCIIVRTHTTLRCIRPC